MAIDITRPVSPLQRAIVLGACATAAVILIAGENYLGLSAVLSGLLFIPLFVAAAYLPRSALFVAAVAVAVALEYFGTTTPWLSLRSAEFGVSLVAFTGGALFAGELIRNRRLSLELVRKTREERTLRLEAEREARALVDSSPAAMLTVNFDSKIAKANEAARQLFGFSVGSPEGDSIEKYIPALARVMRSRSGAQWMPKMMEARGRRLDGQEFYLNAWVSIYPVESGPRLSAILLDVTEQVRDNAEAGLRQLLSNSRIIAGAVSHELRNLAASASILYLNMSNIPDIQGSPDYEALGTVIESVRRLSSTELAETAEGDLDEQVDVIGLLRELRTIITPEYETSAVLLKWEVPDELPEVRADRSGLLQVFLNLAQNTRGALERSADGRLTITAYALPESVLIRFADNGPGISSAERLFQPFQAGASAAGLGLFVSRAIIRTFGGELHHTQRPGECCFIIELLPCGVEATG